MAILIRVSRKFKTRDIKILCFVVVEQYMREASLELNHSQHFLFSERTKSTTKESLYFLIKI